jgi:phenylacetate-CoA ligase
MPEIEFTIREFCHPVAVWRLRRLFERSQWFSPAEMEAYQAQRLREVLAVAYERVPFYREAFAAHGLTPKDIEAPADLAKLPSLTKNTLRREGERMVARDASRHRARRCATSGTTGEPVVVHLDRFSRVLEFVYYWRHWSWGGYRLGDRFAQLNAQHFARRGRVQDLAAYQAPLRRLLLNSSSLSERNVRGLAEAVRRHRPRFLKGLAGPLYYLARLCREAGITDLHFECAFSTGEMLYPQRRAVIEAVFGCQVLDSFGSLEQAAAISQCRAGSYHVHSDYSIVRLAPGHESQPAATTEVIGSTLYNRSMPLLNYATGDLVEPVAAGASCRCGRTLPCVARVHGRREDAVVTPDGRYVTSLFLVPEIIGHLSETQFIQEDERSLVAHVVPLAGFTAAAEVEFIARVRELVGAEIVIRIARVAPEAIQRGPGGKVPLVISKVARGMVGEL